MSKSAILALGATTLLALAGCSAEQLAAAGSTVTVTAAAETTTVENLPDDRVIEQRGGVPAAGTRIVDPLTGEQVTAPEEAFMQATCELLDDGYRVEALVRANVQLGLPFTAERIGELMALAIWVECPQHKDQLDAFAGGGY